MRATIRWGSLMLLVAWTLPGCQRRAAAERSASSSPSGKPRVPSADAAFATVPRRPPAMRSPAARRPAARRVPPRRAAAAAPVVRTLPVRGFAAAAYVRPAGPTNKPRPVLVLLHGSHDRRASECKVWARVGRLRGWLLCPAGVHREDYPAQADRWTWGRVVDAVREVRRGLAALKKRYPGRVIDKRLTLIGFSLGALLAHEMAYFGRGLFRELVVVEGLAYMRWKWARRIKRRGIRRVAVVGGAKSFWPAKARRRTWYLRRVGLEVRHFEIPGVSHEYGDHFDPVARQILKWVQRPYNATPAPRGK